MSAAMPIDGAGKGYIRIFRKMLDHPLFTDKPAAWFKIWMFILLRANWRESVFRPRQGDPITVPAGSMVTSLEKLGTHAALSKEHARRCLDYLERTHAVTLRTTHNWTMITVSNWAAYQQSEDEAQHTEQHTAHHSEFENGTQFATHRTTHAATLSKEVKNLSKKYKSKSDDLDRAPADVATNRRSGSRPPVDEDLRRWFSEEFWPIYPRKEGRVKAIEAASSKATSSEKRAFYLTRLKAQLPGYLQRKRDSGQRVIPLASTWFNQDRAEDELDLSPEPGSQRRAATPGDDYPEYVPLSGSG